MGARMKCVSREADLVAPQPAHGRVSGSTAELTPAFLTAWQETAVSLCLTTTYAFQAYSTFVEKTDLEPHQPLELKFKQKKTHEFLPCSSVRGGLAEPPS